MSIPSPSRPGVVCRSQLVPPGAAWAEHPLVALFDFGHAKGNPISLWLVFSLAGWIQDVFLQHPYS